MKYEVGDRVSTRTYGGGVVTEVHEDCLVVINNNMEEVVVPFSDRIVVVPPSPREAQYSKLHVGDTVRIAFLADAKRAYENNIPTYLLRFLGKSGTVVSHHKHVLSCFVKVDDVIIHIHEDLLTKEGDTT